MSWDKVGEWIKDNAGNSAALVGSLLTGNVAGAVAAGVSMVSDATGTDNPQLALSRLQSDPTIIVELERIKNERSQEVNRHIEAIALANLQDKQKEHETTASVVINGDNADSSVKWVRPMQSSASLIAAIFYVFVSDTVSFEILGLLLALPWGYAGLRQVGKWRGDK